MKFDVQSDNFELYFEKQLSSMNEFQRSRIPPALINKMFRQNGKINHSNVRRMGFVEKLWFLNNIINKRLFIIVEGKEYGVNVDEYIELRKALKGRDFSVQDANDWMAKGNFVVGGKEICDTVSYLNQLSDSAAFNFVAKYRGYKPLPSANHHDQILNIIRFLVNYEGRKRKWLVEHQLDFQEFLVLISLYEKEREATEVYEILYLHVWHVTVAKIRSAVKSLLFRNLIEVPTKRGKRRIFRIMPQGRDLINSVLNNYVKNF